jgi:hypothetical protein
MDCVNIIAEVEDQLQSGIAKIWLRDTRYAISQNGRVFSRAIRIGRKDNGWRELKQLRTGSKKQYSTVYLGAGNRWDVHRLVYTCFKGQIPDGHDVRHLDGNSYNNFLNNLAVGTRKENMQDAVRHGTTCKGSKNSRSKIDEFTALEIRNLCDSKTITMTSIAKRYGVSLECVSQIYRRKRWGWL